MGEFITILTIVLAVASVGAWAAGRVATAAVLLMDALDRRWR
jgi:hypothetical protein